MTEGTMFRSQILTMVAATVLLLGTAGFTAAQDQANDQTAGRQSQGNGGPAQEEGPAGAGNGNIRQLGPGDGTGNQGARPTDGSGYGSPGRLGSGADNAKGRPGIGSGANRQGSGNGTKQGSGGSSARSRSRAVSGSGPGGSLCNGTGQHRGATGMSGAAGGRGRRGGGRR
jgi:hypothetical protein